MAKAKRSVVWNRMDYQGRKSKEGGRGRGEREGEERGEREGREGGMGER